MKCHAVVIASVMVVSGVYGCDDDEKESSTDAGMGAAMGEMGPSSKPIRDAELWDMNDLPPPDRRGRAGPDAAPLPSPECVIETVVVNGVEIFAYESSRADATPQFQGEETDRVCSREGALPWTDVTLPEAEAACGTAGFRLCTDDEWQAACRGEDERQFPYGRTHRAALCNDHVSGANMVRAAGSYPECRTPTGIYDLSGNVWEMTADPSRRGASFRVYASSFRAEAADCNTTFVLFDDYAEDDLGFRCCRTVE